MKSTGAALQVAAILLLIASAASCEVAKEYSTRVFKPTLPQKKNDSTNTALRFMQFDSGNASDSIDLKDFANKEFNEPEKAAFPLDTIIKTEKPVIENNELVKRTPLDATRKGSTRSKRVRQ